MSTQKQKQLDAYKNELKQTRDDLILAYMPALKNMAYKLKARLPASIEVGDLVGAGATAMVSLAASYDKEKNDNFWGYASKRVYGAMLDFLRALDFVSRPNRDLIKRVEAAIDEYFFKFETEPSDEELARILGEEVDAVKDARAASQVSYALPLDEQFAVMGEDMESKVEQEELVGIIKKILVEFSEREQIIIQLHYFEELDFSEIAQVVGVSLARVSQIHASLIKKIRERLKANG